MSAPAAGTGGGVPEARQLASLVAPIHNVGYYTPEIKVFADLGIKGWWTAYFAYRSAPMGQVSAEVITATFYGFAHRMVARAIPEVWRHVGVEQSLEIRLDAVDRAWRRIFADGTADPTADGSGLAHAATVAEATAMLRDAIEGVESGARPLYAGHTALPWPDAPYLQLWHACTLLREHRGDSHSIALAAADIDSVQCQVLMAARGHGNKATLLKIRGWNDQVWGTAVAALVERGWPQPDGTMTEAGRAARRAVEDHTDRLAAEPAHRLGAPGVARLTELLTPVHQHLFTVGEIPGQWPPPHVVKGEEPAR